MADLNEVSPNQNMDLNSLESTNPVENHLDDKIDAMVVDDVENALQIIPEIGDNTPNEEPLFRLPEETAFVKEDSLTACIETFREVSEDFKNCQEVEEKINDKQNIEVEVDSVSETLSDKIEQLSSIPKTENMESVALCSEDKEISLNHVKNLTEPFTDSSQSSISGSEVQSSAPPFESSCSSQEISVKLNRIDFENGIESQPIWKEENSIAPSTVDVKMEVEPPVEQVEMNSTPSEVPIVTNDTSIQPQTPSTEVKPIGDVDCTFLTPGLLPSLPTDQTGAITTPAEIKVEEPEQPLPPPIPLPVIPPPPRKRGRPRKQVLPNPSPLVESWGPNVQQFPSVDDDKKSARAERRQSRKKKLEEEEENGDGTPKRKRKMSQTTPKKKKKYTYIPKKKLSFPKKKHSEIENFQNFEEETRMSASEGPTGFSSRAGGDESQGSSATTDGHTRSSVNKKGRMEVGADGCKPVTVQQIVEYHWPPPASLPHGEKPEALMIQEQISEYLGVKSFKRKYPQIKRRPVDMEERNYLQENGYVSENMCDMGLTAVFAADIIEIMYNDFPHKFDEYRKYTREKKAREQRALREKQAAERADMDPQKEAVESTLSWNSEFNKTRRFRIIHKDASKRLLTDGVPCPTSERLVILHATDNSALCVEDEYWKMTLFSYECEISCHTKIDRSKEYMKSNIWMFLVNTLA